MSHSCVGSDIVGDVRQEFVV